MLVLAQLKKGETAVIKGFEDESLGLALNELGLLVGEVVEYSGRAPLGDPICIKSQESFISLRQKEAAKVLVEKIS